MPMKKILNFLSKRKRLVIVFLVGAVVLIAGRSYFSSKSRQPKTTNIQKGVVREETTLSGVLDAEEKVTLQFQTGGLISWVGVKEGDKVYKYQGIASLDSRQTKKMLDKYLNLYMKTRWDFEQLQDDNKDWEIRDLSDEARTKVRRILEKSQFDLNNSVIDVEVQDLAIKLSSISTPISGVVTKVTSPFAGVNISPQQALFEIVNPASLYFQVTADQEEVVNMENGQDAELTLDSFPEEKLKGKIYFISYTPKQGESGTVYAVKVSIDKKSEILSRLRIGMTGDAAFITKEKEGVLFVEPKYIKSDKEGSYLLIGKEKRKVHIELGIESEDKVEITGDIKEGDLVND